MFDKTSENFGNLRVGSVGKVEFKYLGVGEIALGVDKKHMIVKSCDCTGVKWKDNKLIVTLLAEAAHRGTTKVGTVRVGMLENGEIKKYTFTVSAKVG